MAPFRSWTSGLDNTATPQAEKSRVGSLNSPALLCVTGDSKTVSADPPVAEIAPADAEIFCGEPTAGRVGIRYLRSSEVMTGSRR